jgi:hypothetical protein
MVTTRLPVFEDVGGVKTAVNPSKVVTVTRVNDQHVEINLENGGVVRVELSFEAVLARLVEKPEPAPK